MAFVPGWEGVGILRCAEKPLWALGPPKGTAEPAPGLILVEHPLPVQGGLRQSISEPALRAQSQSRWEKLLGRRKDPGGPARGPMQV